MARLLRLTMVGICLLLVGCQADATLRVDVKDDGTGAVIAAVALDGEAAAKTVLYDNVVALDDL